MTPAPSRLCAARQFHIALASEPRARKRTGAPESRSPQGRPPKDARYHCPEVSTSDSSADLPQPLTL
jgi:hypothetical protein